MSPQFEHAFHELPDPAVKPHGPGHANREAEVAQHAPDVVLSLASAEIWPVRLARGPIARKSPHHEVDTHLMLRSTLP